MAKPRSGSKAPRSSSERPKVSRAQKTREVQDAITAAALELLATNGVDGLALTKIAAHAGMSNGPLYGRYDSAEDVALELWESTLRDQYRKLILEFDAFASSPDASPSDWLLSELTNPSALTCGAVEVVAVARRFPLLVDTVRSDVEELFETICENSPSLPLALSTVRLSIPTGCVMTSRMVPKSRPPWNDVLLRVRDASLNPANWELTSPAPDTTLLEMPIPDTGDAGLDEFVTAVMEVVAKVGFEKTTAHRVARAAGHSFSSAYTHVGTKDELMHTAIAQMIEQIWRTGTTAFVTLDKSSYLESVFALQRGLVATENRPIRQLRVETTIATRHHKDLGTAGQKQIARALSWIPEMFGTKDEKVTTPSTSFWYLTNAHGIGMVTLSLLTNTFSEINWAPIGAIAFQIAEETTLTPLRKLGKI